MIPDFIKQPIPDKFFYWAAILIMLPALLTNLGIVAFINDEGIRALVALEMKLSGNYFVPTLFGEPYYNKPPLYNWILLAFFEFTNTFNEWTARIPTVFFLCTYAATIFYFFKEHFSTKIAFVNAFALITCGRILFYDSFLGLIDICFSWLIFSMFMVIYHQWKKGKFYALFGWAYFLAAAGFMMKGLPAVVFLGTALFAHFVYQKQFKKLFSVAHFFGIGIFILLIGGYYFIYHQYHSLEHIWGTLVYESTKRTAVQFGWTDTFLHLFTFPFEMIFHFLPWTFLVIFCFQKKIVQKILKHEFLTYNLLIFCVTVIPYWISVEVYPRYIFMLVPLVFSILFYLIFENEKVIWQKIFIEKLLKLVCVLAIFLPIVPIFIETMKVEFLYLKIISLMLIFSILALLYHYQKNSRLLVFILVLLVGRLGFDWFVLPSRAKVEWLNQCRNTTIEAVKILNGQPVNIYKDTFGVPYSNAFYLTNGTRKIIRHKMEFEEGEAFIKFPKHYRSLKYDTISTFKVNYDRRIYHIGKFSAAVQQKRQ